MGTSASSVFLAIDGGATHSFGLALDASGHRRAAARAGSLNFHGAGMIEARRNLSQLIEGLGSVISARDGFARCVIGCAALFGEATEPEKRALCDGLLPLDRTRLVGDVLTAFEGASAGNAGVLIIAGTGSVVYARDEAGDDAMIGGWGHLLGDEGGAYWIACESVRAAIAAAEGRGPATRLQGLVCEWLRVSTLHEAVPILYGLEFTKEHWAGLTRYLAEHEASEDAVHLRIRQRAGHQLAAQAVAALGRVNLRSSPARVFLVGGVIEHDCVVRECLVSTLAASYRIQVEKPRLPPVLGAALLAFRDAGIPITLERIDRLREVAASTWPEA